MMTDNRTLQPEMSRTYQTLSKPEKITPAPCYRCGGAGGFNGWPGFTCFRCRGNGVDPTHKEWGFPVGYTLDDMLAFYDKKDETNQKARDRRTAKKEEERVDQLAKNIAAFPGLGPVVDEIVANGHDNDFIMDVYDKMKYFDVSEAQATAVVTAFDRDREWAADEATRVANIPTIEKASGVLIEGRIASLKWKDNQWGGGMKMLVILDNEQKLWGTLPTTLADAGEGDRVSFTANVVASDDDPVFGFFSRPRKGKIVDGQREAGSDE